ncbi:uncharacterized protein LOC122520930 [Polistes fuscatus]|uniref:uncharacterized protein LOC122520930 n=1 Tax=Polistes fuscatus TaxID=30207 RepID=UPI001CA9E51C|nr:uncharacterized protein LOC122520930 [Polistes fuscatus]
MSTNKRRKTSSKCVEQKNVHKHTANECFYYHTLDTLPPEVLEIVLRLLPLHDVATSVRLVSRRCSNVATIVLNAAFLLAGTKLENAMKHTETMIMKVKTGADLLTFSRVFNILEIVMAQYKMLRAVTWRYTHPSKPEKFSRLCFYAGGLLDNLNNLLHRAVNCPVSLSGSHGPDPRIACFISDCKRFMNYFEKVSESKVNRSALVSGCKAVDVLDCLAEGRKVLSFNILSNEGIKNDIISMKLKYEMKRAWFTCLKIPNILDENSWKDQQRFMYLRLRRLVVSVNEHYYENLQYEREVLLQEPSIPPPRMPPVSTYSGYGEYGGQFFYYGNMNKYAYESKFKSLPIIDHENAQDNIEEIQKKSCFNLVIAVELKCSPELAPFAVRTLLRSNELDIYTKTPNHSELYLKLDIMCPASMANRLPGHFTWELNSSRHVHHSS